MHGESNNRDNRVPARYEMAVLIRFVPSIQIEHIVSEMDQKLRSYRVLTFAELTEEFLHFNFTNWLAKMLTDQYMSKECPVVVMVHFVECGVIVTVDVYCETPNKLILGSQT